MLWPGQGLFVGESLAQPYRDYSGFLVKNGHYEIRTRAMRADCRYALEYLSFISGSRHTLARFRVTRAQDRVLYAPLPARFAG